LSRRIALVQPAEAKTQGRRTAAAFASALSSGPVYVSRRKAGKEDPAPPEPEHM